MRKPPPIIGIAGPARSGKDTAAMFLIAQYGGYTYHMAKPLRTMLKAGLNIDLDQPYWSARKEAVIPAIGKSPRQLMQTLGTEWGRQLVHPDLWVTMAAAQLVAHGRGMVVPDIRMENEAAWVRRMGGTIVHLKRDEAAQVNPHSSEDGVLPLPEDITLYNNSSIEALQFAIGKLFSGDEA